MVVFVLLNILTLCSLFDQVSDMCEKTYSRKFVGPRKRQYNNANKRNWKARFLLELLGPVKIARLRRPRANLSNPLIGGRWAAQSNDLVRGFTNG